MGNIDVREVHEAIATADDALDHLQRARQCLNSAGNWGLLDMLGGNMITGLFKHGKMSRAEREIEEARWSLQKFSKELRDVQGFSSIHINDFLTFADFFFDGFVADVLVQSKISNAKKQCDDAIRRVQEIRNQLAGML
ncbi:MAG: hypothetical protein J5959_09815 [Butyrivibrio sp.]|nr:hypothetical protein [Butyrivibrio sp.]